MNDESGGRRPSANGVNEGPNSSKGESSNVSEERIANEEEKPAMKPHAFSSLWSFSLSPFGWLLLSSALSFVLAASRCAQASLSHSFTAVFFVLVLSFSLGLFLTVLLSLIILSGSSGPLRSTLYFYPLRSSSGPISSSFPSSSFSAYFPLLSFLSRLSFRGRRVYYIRIIFFSCYTSSLRLLRSSLSSFGHLLLSSMAGNIMARAAAVER